MCFVSHCRKQCGHLHCVLKHTVMNGNDSVFPLSKYSKNTARKQQYLWPDRYE